MKSTVWKLDFEYELFNRPLLRCFLE